MLLITSARFAEHTTPPGHPERSERAEVFDQVARDDRSRGGQTREPRLATREELARVHTGPYLDKVAALQSRAAMLDSDTVTSPETVEIAWLAAGASIEAARHAREHGEPALAMVRPPGHHAEADKAMGFCLYSNIAVAAAALRADGAARVAIVDIDVHHGNGTQAIFYENPTVLFVSSHQYPYYPGTGAVEETGAGSGRGFTVNMPMDAGTGDAAFLAAYADVAVPAVDRFAPDTILVSAGFDAHERDPLGGLKVTTGGFTRVITLLDDAARRLCSRRLAVITEGGYDLTALGDCLRATIEVLNRE
jgi:acetoin utilization deacetylase AcuC-like enzyme